MRTLSLTRDWNAVSMPPEGWNGNNYFTAGTGHKIRYGFAPAKGESRGTLILTHGYSEHIDLYYEAIKFFQKQGYDVWAMDAHEQGLSGRTDPGRPTKPSAQGLWDDVEDLHDFVTKIVRPAPDKPTVLNTHSMGGHIGMLYMQKYADSFDGAIMASPMLDLYRLGMSENVRPFLRFLFRAASAAGLRDVSVPRFKGLREKFHFAASCLGLTKDSRTLRQQWDDMLREQHKDAEIDSPTFGWIAATFPSTDLILREDNLKKIKAHVLIGSAEKEDLVDTEAHSRAAYFIPRGQHIVLRNAHHNLWQEGDENYHKWTGSIRNFLRDVEADFYGTAPAAARKEVTLPFSESSPGFSPGPVPLAA